ncbi:MAG: Flp pilus assembly complex ATPase component TadA, partial [Planctomycetes bacterium]|nr:Flp pilus assembly complex ATPase component TadA [Planctomycetota bacterium]
DPIEYIHLPRRALVHQRQVGAHASSFHEALVAALREDPDVILLGEVRDLDTIRTVIRAAETGHLVFTTVHAGDCVGALERLVSVFPASEQAGIRTQLGLVLRAVVAQRLLPASPLADDAIAVDRARVVASEVLRTTPAIAHLIASGRSAQIYAAMETGSRLGMQTIEHDLARLVGAGRITEATAIGHSRSAELLNERTSQQARRPLERGAS